MDSTLTTTIVGTSGAVITGVYGMFFTANQLGRRIDDIRADIKEIRSVIAEMAESINAATRNIPN